MLLRLAGFLVLGLSVLAATPAIAEELRVLTFNVKVDLESDDEVKPWPERRDAVAQVVKESKADLIGLEESSPGQMAYFREQLPEFESIGEIPLSPEDLEVITQRVPVFKALKATTFTDVVLFYRKDKFEKIDAGHWWLSPTPERVSAGFGNALPRVLVWAKLKHKPTDRELVVAVTHFDNTKPSQEKMAALSREKLQPFVDQGLPVLFMGDFNTDQERGDYPLLTSGGWRDSYVVSPLASPDGRDSNVVTAFGRRIDHIFYHGESLVPQTWTRLESPVPGIALSDHYPVLATFEWK